MIECIFTIDYEIYGNGEGSLRDLIYEPAERLLAIFRKAKKRFVPFIEVAELEVIEAVGADSTIKEIKKQIQIFHKEGFELGLHLHPQWYNARYEHEHWTLDYSEYNLCILPQKRIEEIIDRAIDYFRKNLGLTDFTPMSYRAGNWLFQPTQPAAKVLADRGIKIDSSVFKGGLQHQQNLDYRDAIRNGQYWKFMDDVNFPDPEGALLELPIYAQMVPFWKMLTTKRVGLQRKAPTGKQMAQNRLYRFMDFLRFRQPLKLDFCRMTIYELASMMDKVIKDDELDSESFRPIIAIGHTKDLVDFETVEAFLSYLEKNKINVATFENIYKKCCAGSNNG
jgi:hypothetical protein